MSVVRYFEFFWSIIARYVSPSTLFFITEVASQTLVWWPVVLTFAALDYFQPKALVRHQIMPRHNITSKQVKDCVYVVLRNQTILFTMQCALLYFYKGSFGIRSPRTLPTALETVRDTLLFFLGREILGYSLHRYILHHPRVYRYCHKQHHKFANPFSMASQYGHPLEHVLITYIPIIIPAAWLRMHILTYFLCRALAQAETAIIHSGFNIGHLTQIHDLHHEKSEVYFGNYGLMDYVMGTNELKKKSIEKVKSCD